MSDDEYIVDKCQQFGSTSHSLILGVAFDMFEDFVVGQFEGGLYASDGVFLGGPVMADKNGLGCFRKDAAGHFPGGSPSHAVSHQAIVAFIANVENVFVVIADIAHIRGTVVNDGWQVLWHLSFTLSNPIGFQDSRNIDSGKVNLPC
jgi:hypothetical protein